MNKLQALVNNEWEETKQWLYKLLKHIYFETAIFFWYFTFNWLIVERNDTLLLLHDSGLWSQVFMAHRHSIITPSHQTSATMGSWPALLQAATETCFVISALHNESLNKNHSPFKEARHNFLSLNMKEAILLLFLTAYHCHAITSFLAVG